AFFAYFFLIFSALRARFLSCSVFRVRETLDPYNGGFLVLPSHDQEVDLEDGVCFSFNLDVLPALPAKIRIYQREYEGDDPWVQIGSLTEFDTIKGMRTLRGSAVWIPELEGEYEVQAVVVDGTGTVIASEIRRVDVGSNTPPAINITGGPPTPSSTAQDAVFTAIATDIDGDKIRRVEFYDDGILIGSDVTPEEVSPGVFEFGDDIEDIEEGFYFLLRGTHNITAKAFDERGGVGETVSPSQYVITSGNARPIISVTNPVDVVSVNQGHSFSVSYSTSDPDGVMDLVEVEAYDIMTFSGDVDSSPPFGSLSIDTAGWELGEHTIRVVSRDNSGAESYPQYLTVFVRSAGGDIFAETLVENITDETAVVSNEIFRGVEASSNVFHSGLASGLEIDSGVLLTTGSFALWNGGDDDLENEEAMDERRDPAFGINNIELGDSDLQSRVSGERTSDAAVLEFDVFCSDGQLEIVYQFGSEEYDEFVGDFNDGFMATVNGVLVTLVPDCSDIVAVNSVYPFLSPIHTTRQKLRGEKAI
ncbi:choice-of-anchor L domain-containing protein, partial [Roseibacillus ishigakijimensis]